MWRQKKLKKKLYIFLRDKAKTRARENRQINFCLEFLDAGLKRRGMKAFKLFA
jgi:hypothetical protein